MGVIGLTSSAKGLVPNIIILHVNFHVQIILKDPKILDTSNSLKFLCHLIKSHMATGYTLWSAAASMVNSSGRESRNPCHCASLCARQPIFFKNSATFS